MRSAWRLWIIFLITLSVISFCGNVDDDYDRNDVPPGYDFKSCPHKGYINTHGGCVRGYDE